MDGRRTLSKWELLSKKCEACFYPALMSQLEKGNSPLALLKNIRNTYSYKHH